ncbi:MAG: hypothetical protein NT080_07995 [Spirochaetes bacterium]|nr:hypothetical protein [Spirochaetota bacterium]
MEPRTCSLRPARAALVGTVFALALALGCAGAARPAEPRTEPAAVSDEPMSLEYAAPEIRIFWSGGRGMDVTHIIYSYDSPIADTPSGQRNEDFIVALDGSQAAALRKAVMADADAFFAMNDWYGAPAGQRYYPYSLTIQIGERSKTVLYRSNPGYDEPPEPFGRLVGAVTTLLGT